MNLNYLLWPLIFFTALMAFAEENPPAPAQSLPNVRELTPGQYQLLGKLVWEKVQRSPDYSKHEYSTDELSKMIDSARRNREELAITLDELLPLLDCQGGSVKQSYPGVQLDDVGKLFK